MRRITIIVSVVAALIAVAGCNQPTGSGDGELGGGGSLSSNASLASLSIGGATLVPGFDPGVTEYTATVAEAVDVVTVSASVQDVDAMIVSGTGDRTLYHGLTELSVRTEAEDGTQKRYSVSVNRGDYDVRTFRAQRVTDSAWYDVPAALLAEGTNVLVYCEQSSGVDAGTAATIAGEFDASIHGLIQANFGDEEDVDSNGKVILLLLDIVDGYAGSGGYVAGYFSSAHMYSSAVFSDSNEADMVFMDVNPAVAASESFYNTAAHEMQHLVNWSATVGQGGSSQDLWINEGLSSGAEYLYAGEHVQSRINYFNSDPVGTIAYGNNFFVWNGYWEQVYGDVLADYATVYLFFQWLRIHAGNGAGIYKEILASSHSNHEAVTEVAAIRINSAYVDWAALLGDWMTANLLEESTGPYGYGSDSVDLSVSGIPNATFDYLSLSSGEGAFVVTDGGAYDYPGGSGTDVFYRGITLFDGAVDSAGVTYSGDVVLAYNANTAIGASDQAAYVPRVESVLPQLSANSAVASVVLPDSYPVDVHFGPTGELHPDSHRP